MDAQCVLRVRASCKRSRHRTRCGCWLRACVVLTSTAFVRPFEACPTFSSPTRQHVVLHCRRLTRGCPRAAEQADGSAPRCASACRRQGAPWTVGTAASAQPSRGARRAVLLVRRASDGGVVSVWLADHEAPRRAHAGRAASAKGGRLARKHCAVSARALCGAGAPCRGVSLEVFSCLLASHAPAPRRPSLRVCRTAARLRWPSTRPRRPALTAAPRSARRRGT